MKQLSNEKQQEIISGIIQSDIPSKIAQGVAKYLEDIFLKLPECKLPAKEVQEESNENK